MEQDLYLFTTLTEPAEKVTAPYGERRNIETDLRSVKDEMRLHTIETMRPNAAKPSDWFRVYWNIV
jgi:hypothetical protein